MAGEARRGLGFPPRLSHTEWTEPGSCLRTATPPGVRVPPRFRIPGGWGTRQSGCPGTFGISAREFSPNPAFLPPLSRANGAPPTGSGEDIHGDPISFRAWGQVLGGNDVYPIPTSPTIPMTPVCLCCPSRGTVNAAGVEKNPGSGGGLVAPCRSAAFFPFQF